MDLNKTMTLTPFGPVQRYNRETCCCQTTSDLLRIAFQPVNSTLHTTWETASVKRARCMLRVITADLKPFSFQVDLDPAERAQKSELYIACEKHVPGWTGVAASALVIKKSKIGYKVSMIDKESCSATKPSQVLIPSPS